MVVRHSWHSHGWSNEELYSKHLAERLMAVNRLRSKEEFAISSQTAASGPLGVGTNVWALYILSRGLRQCIVWCWYWNMVTVDNIKDNLQSLSSQLIRQEAPFDSCLRDIRDCLQSSTLLPIFNPDTLAFDRSVSVLWFSCYIAFKFSDCFHTSYTPISGEMVDKMFKGVVYVPPQVHFMDSPNSWFWPVSYILCPWSFFVWHPAILKIGPH